MKLLVRLLTLGLLVGCSQVEAKSNQLVAYTLNPKEEIIVELGTKELKIREFFEGSQSYTLIDKYGSVDYDDKVLESIGEYEVKLVFSNFTAYEGVETFILPVGIKVRDTKAPDLKLKNVEVTEGDLVALESFIESATDLQKVTTSFKETYDLSSVGERKIIVIATDESGNKSEQEATLHVKEKYVAPVYNPPANNWGGSNGGGYNPPANNGGGGSAPTISESIYDYETKFPDFSSCEAVYARKESEAWSNNAWKVDGGCDDFGLGYIYLSFLAHYR